jgi:hypothetical protein
MKITSGTSQMNSNCQQRKKCSTEAQSNRLIESSSEGVEILHFSVNFFSKLSIDLWWSCDMCDVTGETKSSEIVMSGMEIWSKLILIMLFAIFLNFLAEWCAFTTSNVIYTKLLTTSEQYIWNQQQRWQVIIHISSTRIKFVHYCSISQCHIHCVIIQPWKICTKYKYHASIMSASS